MKKISFKKIILLVLIASILSIGLSGCIDIIVPTTGTIRVIIADDYYSYRVYMDNKYIGTTPEVKVGLKSERTFDNIPIGFRSFYVISTDDRYEGWKDQIIYSGHNIVEIYTEKIY